MKFAENFVAAISPQTLFAALIYAIKSAEVIGNFL